MYYNGNVIQPQDKLNWTELKNALTSVCFKIAIKQKGFSLQTVAAIVMRKSLHLGQPTALFTHRC